MQIKIYNHSPPSSKILSEVVEDLSHKPATLNPKFFYDPYGCELFDKICQLPEYYITRTEIELLKKHKSTIATLVGRKNVIIEPGSGSSQKTKILLQELKPNLYIAIDISSSYLAKAAESLAKVFPWLKFRAICADIFNPIQLRALALPHSHKPMVFFSGSSIGNFSPEQSQRFLKDWVNILSKKNGALLIGVDIKKPKSILEAAYNDSSGVTAKFNLNILRVINRECRANFDLNKFSHHAFYNEEQGRIEMHLISQVIQQVNIGGHVFNFEKGESIHTENSYKYSIEEFQGLLRLVGFRSLRVWQDSQNLFSLHYCEV